MNYIKLNNADIFEIGKTSKYHFDPYPSLLEKDSANVYKYFYYIPQKKIIIYVDKLFMKYLLNDGLDIIENVPEGLKINCKVKLTSKLIKVTN